MHLMIERTKSRVAADAWGSLLRVHARLVPIMDVELQAKTGLPLGWYDILLELSVADDHSLTMGDLASRVVLSRTRVSRVVDEMVRGGLLRRCAHPDDKRSAFATLTELGIQRFREAAPTYLAAIDAHVASPLSKAELEQLATLLERIIAASVAARPITSSTDPSRAR
jgi:DNA-binding MarR family transcriptional regulator